MKISTYLNGKMIIRTVYTRKTASDYIIIEGTKREIKKNADLLEMVSYDGISYQDAKEVERFEEIENTEKAGEKNMKLTDLAKEIELSEEELNSEVIERAFPIDAYFQERLWICGTQEDFDELPNLSSHNHFQGVGYYDEKGLLFGLEDQHVISCLTVENGDIVAASYSVDNFRNNTAGDSIEDDVDGVVDLWIKTFEF